MIDYKAVRQTTSFGAFSHEAYTDPGTFAGADPDPTLDDGDEIAMMAKDAGSRRRCRSEPGRASSPSTRTAGRDRRPAQLRHERFIYLFETDSGLDPAAGKSYVDYDFSLDSGDYKTTYDWNGVADDERRAPPANTEDSTVTTPLLLTASRSRDGSTDELAVKAGDATGVDILDGDKVQVGFGCGRSELTFSRGGGGFIANRSGPVRAIRSYIGANSGTFTQQDRIYYQRAEVMKTYLRVHPGINTIDQFLDYSPAASGMTYRTSADPGGVTIDGVPDGDLETGNSLGPELTWEQATGPQGKPRDRQPGRHRHPDLQRRLLLPGRLDLAGHSRNAEATPTIRPGARAVPGSPGSALNTDPTLGPASSLTGTRTIFYSAPGADAALAELRSDQVDSPLEAGASAEAEPPRPALLKLRAHGRKKSVEPGRQRPGPGQNREHERRRRHRDRGLREDRAACRVREPLPNRREIGAGQGPLGAVPGDRHQPAAALDQGQLQGHRRRLQARQEVSQDRDQALARRPAGGYVCGWAIPTKSSASSRVASSTPLSIATSRTVRPDDAASLTISAAAS